MSKAPDFETLDIRGMVRFLANHQSGRTEFPFNCRSTHLRRVGVFCISFLLIAGCEPEFIRRSLEPVYVANNELDEIIADKREGNWAITGPIPRESAVRLGELFPPDTTIVKIKSYFLGIGGRCFPVSTSNYTICRYCKTKILRSQEYLRRFYSLKETVWQLEIYPPPTDTQKIEDEPVSGALALRMGLGGASFPPDWDYTTAAEDCGIALSILNYQPQSVVDSIAPLRWIYWQTDFE